MPNYYAYIRKLFNLVMLTIREGRWDRLRV
jgi:hypothetical protein